MVSCPQTGAPHGVWCATGVCTPGEPKLNPDPCAGAVHCLRHTHAPQGRFNLDGGRGMRNKHVSLTSLGRGGKGRLQAMLNERSTGVGYGQRQVL